MRVDGAGYVRTRRAVQQSPLSDAPAVPVCWCGHIEDEADGYYWIDFGEPYGVVCCEQEDLQ